MKAGIMQPYFFPYLNHFKMIELCDIWIVFDITQFRRKSWMHRNRILNKEKEWSYINVPYLHTGLETSISNAEINTEKPWKETLLKKLQVYEKHAPYYQQAVSVVEETLSFDGKSIAGLNTEILKIISRYLDIETPINRLSMMDIDLPRKCDPGHWALEICKKINATQYLNPDSGQHLFDKNLYQKNGIALEFYQHIPFEYNTAPFDFVDGLSIIDALMWNSRDKLIDFIKV